MISTRRSYVYDEETGLYYLQSRYYNPEWGRFLNADALVATGQGMLGNNMFAYCGNNPVNKADPTGCAFVNIDWDFDGLPNSLFIDAGAGGGFAIAGVANSSGMAEDVAYFAKKAGKAMGGMAKKVGNWFASGAEFIWDAYMRSYNLQQNAQMQEAQMMIGTIDAVCDYVTSDAFWDSDVGVVAENTLIGAGVGTIRGLATGIKSGIIVGLCTGNIGAAVAVAGAEVFSGMAQGAIDGFIGGLIVIAIS